MADHEETFAERLARLQSEKGLSIAELARAAKATEAAIRSLLTGRTKGPLLMTGLRLANALGVSPWYIAAGIEYDPAETGLRSLEARLVAETEHRELQIDGLNHRVSTLEDQVAAVLRRIAPG